MKFGEQNFELQKILSKLTFLISVRNYDYGTSHETTAAYCVWTSLVSDFNGDELAINFNLKSFCLVVCFPFQFREKWVLIIETSFVVQALKCCSDLSSFFLIHSVLNNRNEETKCCFNNITSPDKLLMTVATYFLGTSITQGTF